MICGRCEADNPDGARFCDACGVALERGCAACGAINRPRARFCGQCGAALADAPAAAHAGALVSGEGERKQVTVLFADLRGSTGLIEALDPEQAMQWLDPAIRSMTEAVTRFGGVVNRVQGDGIMALFGAPLACEDHAVRACLAARAMIAAVGAFDRPELAIRVGMNSGDVVVRSTGNDPSDYDAVGITAHLAARMEQLAAPGSACLTASTARQARGFVEVASRGLVAVKGLAAPIEVFELIAAAERPGWEARAAARPLAGFFGRAAEMALLQGALARAAAGRGQVISVIAEAGLGKSRLAHEFIAAAAPAGWQVLIAAAAPHSDGAPLQLAAMLARAWLDVSVDDERIDIARKLDAALDAAGDAALATELRAPLQALLDLPVGDAGWAALDPAVRRERIVAALRRVLVRQAARGRLLLLIEDLHWADSASVEALDALIEGCAAVPVLALVTLRPGAALPWAARSFAAELSLPPLAPESAEALLCELLGADDDLAPLRRRILAQADGTPLFIEEICRALQEEGVVVSEPARVRLAAAAEQVRIPDTVQSILAARIDRLPAERRRLLQVASVIGKDVPLALLRGVADLPEPVLRGELAALQAAEFLYELAGPRESETFTFRHALTQATAYEGMLRRHRRELHARVFDALAAQAGDRIDEATDLLALHALRGERWAAAVEFSHRAGRRANARFAWREAIAYLEQAIEALARLPCDANTTATAIALRLDLRVALAATGDLTRIVQSLDEARALAAGAGDTMRVAGIDVSRCMALTNLGGLDAAIAAGRASLDAARAGSDPAALVTASFALGQAYWFHGDFAEAASVLSQALPAVRAPGSVFASGTTGSAPVLHLVCLAKTHAMTGDFADAEAIAAEALAVAGHTGRPYDAAYARLAGGFVRLLRGEPASAPLSEALEIARRAEIRLLLPSIVRYLGRTLALEGRAGEGRVLLDEVIAQTEAQGLRGLRAWCGLALGFAQEGEAAERTLGETIEIARRHGYRPVEAQALRLLGARLAAAGRQAEAEGLLAGAAALAEALGMRPELALALEQLAALRGRPEETARATELRRRMGLDVTVALTG